MKVLMLVNWKVRYCSGSPKDLQPPDYYCKSVPYWFFRYFAGEWNVDVIDISSVPAIESFEKKTLRFYVIQALRAIPNLSKYDLIVSHGMQSGVVLSLWRRLFRTKAKHIVFDIGSFASASEHGAALKLMQIASKSIDGLIYHTSSQIDYYKKFFPWLVDRAKFVPFGTDLDYFKPLHAAANDSESTENSYILCAGYSKRDWETLVKAYSLIDTDVKLRLVGHEEEQYMDTRGVQMVPFVPIEELKRQISNALFCVLPLQSFNYSYGQMTLMQKMAMGKCVVAARVPSLIDYAEDGRSALFYTPGDPLDLSRVMKLVLKDSKRRESIGLEARNFLSAHRNERAMACDIEEFLERTLADGREG